MKKQKVFISYSWDKNETIDFVLELARKLGDYQEVEVILDRYHLALGHDLNSFMENSIEESDKILIICDESYKNKANSREKGAGIETQIISSQVYSSVTQTKVIPVIIDRMSNVPIYLKSRLGIMVENYNLSDKKIDEIMIGVLDIKEIEPPPKSKSFFKEKQKTLNIKRDLKDITLSKLSIKTLVGYITGDLKKTLYRSGPQLIDLFNKFGKRDIYSWKDGGLPGKVSRKQYVEDYLNDLNNTKYLKEVIETIVDRRHYIATEFNLDNAVNEINQILSYDGYKLIDENGKYKLTLN